MVRRAALVLVCGAGLVCPVAVGPSVSLARADPTRDFTDQERARLRAGRLVERRVTKRKGGLDLMGGTSWQVIDAPPSVIWEALLDTRYYPRMMPRVLEARLVKDRGNERLVWLKQGAAFIETSYYINVNLHPERRDLTFAVDDTRPHHAVKAAWGFYTVRPYGKGRSILSYGVMADIGEGVLKSLMRETVHEWMLKVPWMVKRFVEGSGRWIYKRD